MMQRQDQMPLDYRIRVSQRAKNVSIHISHQGEVEVVIPQGFDPTRIPDLILRRHDWIEKTTQRLARDRQSAPTDHTAVLPEQVHLRAIAEDWQVTYRPVNAAGITLGMAGDRHLRLQGNTQEPHLCHSGLHRWLHRKAHQAFEPWLRRISQDIGLPYRRMSIRRQKTLWASCSSRDAISLNAKLLFLPPELVRYVFIHELCHTVHLNHSPQFWALVGEKDPHYKAADRDLRKAWRYVPAWANSP